VSNLFDTHAPCQIHRDWEALRRADAMVEAQERGYPSACPDCGGTIGGMVAFERSFVNPIAGPWYRLADDEHNLYRTCWQCNSRRHVPAGYEAVDAAWVQAWLARRCECADCRRERMESAAPADGDGRRGRERMYR
jgi:hypothetical protein